MHICPMVSTHKDQLSRQIELYPTLWALDWCKRTLLKGMSFHWYVNNSLTTPWKGMHVLFKLGKQCKKGKKEERKREGGREGKGRETLGSTFCQKCCVRRKKRQQSRALTRKQPEPGLRRKLMLLILLLFDSAWDISRSNAMNCHRTLFTIKSHLLIGSDFLTSLPLPVWNHGKK